MLSPNEPDVVQNGQKGTPTPRVGVGGSLFTFHRVFVLKGKHEDLEMASKFLLEQWTDGNVGVNYRPFPKLLGVEKKDAQIKEREHVQKYPEKNKFLVLPGVERRKNRNYRLAARRFPALQVSFLDFLPAAGLSKILLGTIYFQR